MKRNNSLDAIRGVAAICVVLLHARNLIGHQIAPHGYLAVDLFYVLSGYVISKAYDGRFSAGMPVKQFTVIRLIRFYPLYVLGLCIGFTREALGTVVSSSHAMSPFSLLSSLLLGALFIPFPYRDPNLFPLNVPSWSLFYELIINFIYGASFNLLGNIRRLTVLTFITGLILTFAILKKGSADIGALAPDALPAIARTAFSFGGGVLLSRISWAAPRVPAAFLIMIVAILLLFPNSGSWYDILFVLIASPAIVAFGAQSIEEQALQPIYRYLGAISFPIYAVHRPILSFAEGLAKKGYPPSTLLAFSLICLLFFSWILNEFFDKVIQVKIKHYRIIRFSRLKHPSQNGV